MFPVRPPAIAPNSFRVRLPPSPGKTAVFSSISTTPAADLASSLPATLARSRRFIFIPAASSTASRLASAWCSTKAASARRSSSISASKTFASSLTIRKKSSPSKATASALRTKCRFAAKHRAPPTKLSDSAARANVVCLPQAIRLVLSEAENDSRRWTSTACLPGAVSAGLIWGRGLLRWGVGLFRLRLRRRSLARGRRFPHRQILAHLIEAFLADPSDRQQIVHALERAIRFSHLQDFFRRRRPDAWNLLQFFRSRRIDVHRPQRRVLHRRGGCSYEEKESEEEARDECPDR